MQMAEQKCPKCGSNETQSVHGKTSKGNVRYRCRDCLKNYILEEPKYNSEFKKSAIRAYLEGNSGRAVGRILGFGKTTFWRWLQEYEANLPKTEENDVDIAEMDELYTHIKKGK